MEPSAGRVSAADSWSNPAYTFDPIVGIQLVLRRDGRVLENRFVAGRVADPEVLRSYYHRVHAEHGYTPAEPFLHELHAAMLRKLERRFLPRLSPRSPGLDAGGGRRPFTDIRPEWRLGTEAAGV